MPFHGTAVRISFALIAGLLPLFAQSKIEQQYRETAARLIGAALVDEDAYRKLAYLCDRIGNRLSGSPGLQKAVEWGAAEMRKSNLENVTTPVVRVPHWVRGRESGVITTPEPHQLSLLGLGGSVGTPPAGITAETVVVRSFDELEKLGRQVAGKIVVYNVPYEGYGKTVMYRVAGASRAAKFGAVATLLRSVTPLSLQSPHTGVMMYAADGLRIPAAAVSIENATLLQRLYDGGTPATVTLKMEAQTLPEAESANVIGEIRGREKPTEVVVIGGHLDSWDVGQGAHDDGGGVVSALEAVTLIRRLGLKPRRTIRVVMWTNEENGTNGGKAYRQWVGDEVKNHVAAIEMDEGAERPTGFGLTGGSPRAMETMRQIGQLLAGIGANTMVPRGGGSDIQALQEAGVPVLGLNTVGTHYFDWHHTQSDTLDKVDPQDLKLNVATMAVMAYVLADMEERL